MYNTVFIELLDALATMMTKHGEPFRAKAYQKAQETIMNYKQPILSVEQIKGLPGIGPTICDKLNEFVTYGKLTVLEQEKNNPINILGEVYGIGPKKAQELVKANIRTIADLRSKQHEVLNDIQRVGLKYHEQIMQRIPRSEIQQYEALIQMLTATYSAFEFEIVGSYRRGAETSGDIDIIVGSQEGYTKLIDELIAKRVIKEVLSRGPSKTLVIAQLSNDAVARRLDFLYSPPNEYAFATLYFTGSKTFNTVMRQHALNLGYTFNEHGIYRLDNDGKKGALVTEVAFAVEQDIFDFLGLEYKSPQERTNCLAVVPIVAAISSSSSSATATLDAISSFQQKGISFLNSLSQDKLTSMIQLANKEYHTHGTPVMTDSQYDVLKDFVEAKYPCNPVLSQVGAEVERNKVVLPFEMPSMNKIKTNAAVLADWASTYQGPYVLSCKLDGVSGLYIQSKNGKKLYTRGDGKVGQDVTHLIPHLLLPQVSCGETVSIRGEFIIAKQTFEQKYKSTFANARNMVAGIINGKRISKAIKDVHFVAYEVINSNLTFVEQMRYLEQIKAPRQVLYQIRNTIDVKHLSDLLVECRANYAYEIDGIIVADGGQVHERKSGNPDYAFAFKMLLDDQSAEATVADVLWSPSKDGYLKPRVQIVPVQIGGVTIEFVTGFNAAFIEERKINVGTVVKIVRSGDVIPIIEEVLVPSIKGKLPDEPFTWTETHVDIVLVNQADNAIVKEKNITGFFKALEVDGLGSGNVTRLVEAGFDSVPTILAMKPANFLQVAGFKDKMANKLYTNIQTSVQKATLIQLMVGSNLFGRGLSEKIFEMILEAEPTIMLSIIGAESDDLTHRLENAKKRLLQIKGIGATTAFSFVTNVRRFHRFLQECGLSHKLEVVPTATAASSSSSSSSSLSLSIFAGKTVVLTGTRDKAIQDYLNSVGAKQGSSVSKNTYLVIAKNKDDKTGKVLDAEKCGVPVMNADEFVAKYM